MAGITAVSSSFTLGSGSAIPDNSVSGFKNKEQVSLGVTPSPSTILWSISKPYGSNITSKISDVNSYNPVFTPDKSGVYTVSCLVNGSDTYVLRINVAETSISTFLSSIHFIPTPNVSVTAPKSGGILFWSQDSDKLSIKNTDDTVDEIQVL